MAIAYALGTINGYLIFTFFYIVLVGLYSMIYRAAVFLRADSLRETYWEPVSGQDTTIEALKRQF